MNQAAELLIWLVAQSARLKVEQKLTSFDWQPPIFHFTFKTHLLDPVVSGHACSFDLAEAKLKAAVEFLERLNLRLKFKGSLSIGFACHFDPQQAQQNAYNELLERDSFLWHWHTFTPPVLLAQDYLAGLQSQTFRLQCRDPKVHVVMSTLRTNQDQILFGLGSHENEQRAREKSFLEAQASLHNLKINSPLPMSLEEFERQPRVIPRHHFQLSLSQQYTQLFEQWLRSDSSLGIPPLPLITINECPWDESLTGHQLKMYQAKSDDLFKFYFGKNPYENVPNALPHPMA